MSRWGRVLFVCVVVALVASLGLNYHFLRGEGKSNGKPAAMDSELPATPPQQPREKEEPAKEELYIRYADISFGNTLEIAFNRILDEDVRKEDVVVMPACDISYVSSYAYYVNIQGNWKPGEVYSVIVKVGEEKYTSVIVAPDHQATLGFRSQGKLFPLSNDFWNLGVSSENLRGDLMVRVMEAYPNQVLRFLNNPGEESYSHAISEKVYPLKKVKNQKETLVLDLEEAGVPRKPGLYSLRIADSDQIWKNRTQALIVTDLGVIVECNQNELEVAVRSLKDNSPIHAAEVELYTRKYQLVANARTDEDGFCKLPYCELTDQDDVIAFAVVTKDDDRTVCPARFWFDKQLPMHAELYSERGICRPGEAMRIYATLRDGKLVSQGSVPLEFRLCDSRGKVLEKKVVTGDALGLYAVNFAIPENALFGEYTVRANVPGNDDLCCGGTEFLVGEYIPDRIRVTQECQADKDACTLTVANRAAYYFGLPFDNGIVRQRLSARYGTFAPKGFEDFTFGVPRGESELFSCKSGDQPLKPDGTYRTSYNLSEWKKLTANPVEIDVDSSCVPAGAGRTVSANQKVLWNFAEYYLGGCHDAEAKELRFRLIGVSPEGKEMTLMDKDLRFKLHHASWDYVLKESYDGRKYRVWERSNTLLQEGAVVLENGWLKLDSRGIQGEFQLELFDSNDVCRLSMEVWHWGGECGARLKDPRSLTFELDKMDYLPGETALVTFECGMEGEGIAFPGLYAFSKPIRFPVKVGTNQLRIPIPPELPHGNYFAELHVLSRKDTASDPMHFQGMVELTVRQEKHHIRVEVETPAEARPGMEMPIAVKLTDAQGKPVVGEVLIWGVDEGILALTAYKTPNPFEDFFKKAMNPLESRDNYESLYPVINAGTEKIGGGVNCSAFSCAPRRSKDVETLKKAAVVFLGTFTTDDAGVAKATATLPDFTGEMRIMAIAVTREATGSGAAPTVIHREVELELTAPRAVAPGDDFNFVFQAFNHALPQGAAHWEASMEEGLENKGNAQGDFVLSQGENAIGVLKLKAGASEGVRKVRLKLTMGDCQVTQEASVVIRSPYPMITILETIGIPAGEERDFDLAEYSSVDLGTTALALTSSLEWLGRYPYGCLEQITATAFPLLAVQPLVDAGVLPQIYAADAQQKIKSAQMQLAAHRRFNGWMTMWPEGSIWTEGSCFAYLFYLEAERQGFPLEKSFRDQMEKNLMECQNSTTAENNELRAFASLVLSYLNPKMAFAHARTLDNAKCDGFCRFLKAVVQIRGGYAAEGMAELEACLKSDFAVDHDELYGYDSEIRRMGIALWILADVVPEDPILEKFANALLQRRNAEGHWGNTQDNAWATLGLARYCAKNAVKGKFSMRVAVDGQEEECSAARHFIGPKKFRVKNTSQGTIQAFVRRMGNPAPTDTVSNGVAIHREYQDLDGNKVTQAKRGDLLRVVMKVTFMNKNVGEYVISDLLPGGLEIEDDELASRARAFDPKEQKKLSFPVHYLEKRFDRFLAFGDSDFAKVDTEYTYTYQVRAVSEGNFAIAPIAIESMYRPDLKAVEMTEEGSFTVLPVEPAQ